jgi:hypothetical protein
MRGWAFGLAGLSCAIGLFAFACSSEEPSTGPTTGGGDASSEGSTSPTGDGATNGDGSIATGPTTPLDPAVAARAALLIATCVSDDGVNRTLQQIYLERTTNPYRSRAVLECLGAKTNGCAAITDCLGIAYSTDGGCGDASCAGNVYQECTSSFRLTVDCSKTARTCVAKPSTYCAAADEVECVESTTPGVCDGTTPISCVDGLLRRGQDCARFGATCGVLYTYGQTAGSMTGCKGAGGSCTGTSNDDAITARWEGQRCENGKLVGCLSNGLATLDCAESAAGFTCFDSPDGGTGATAYCGSAAECAPKSPWNKVAATCDGTSVVMCNGGKIEKLDCTTLGFTGCNAGLCTPGFF